MVIDDIMQTYQKYESIFFRFLSIAKARQVTQLLNRFSVLDEIAFLKFTLRNKWGFPYRYTFISSRPGFKGSSSHLNYIPPSVSSFQVFPLLMSSLFVFFFIGSHFPTATKSPFFDIFRLGNSCEWKSWNREKGCVPFFTELSVCVWEQSAWKLS